MPTVRVVTDSSCDLPTELIRDLPITVLPNRVRLGDETLLDGVDLSAPQIYARAQELMAPPRVEPPDLTAFTHAYSSLARQTDSIISIHGSERLGEVLPVALKARGYHYDRCQVAVLDSESATMGLGYIVLQAARAAQAGADLREIIDLVRTIVHQTHVIFAADASEAAQLMARAQAQADVVGNGLGGTAVAVAPVQAAPTPINARPILKLEEGRIVPLEQVRNRTKALERLYEFVEIFPRVEDLTIVHGRSLTDVEWLLKRIDPIFPRKQVRVVPYGPATARHVGTNAVGVVAYEGLDE